MNDHKYIGLKQQLDNCQRELGRKDTEVTKLREALKKAIDIIDGCSAMPVDIDDLRDIATGRRKRG